MNPKHHPIHHMLDLCPTCWNDQCDEIINIYLGKVSEPALDISFLLYYPSWVVRHYWLVRRRLESAYVVKLAGSSILSGGKTAHLLAKSRIADQRANGI